MRFFSSLLSLLSDLKWLALVIIFSICYGVLWMSGLFVLFLLTSWFALLWLLPPLLVAVAIRLHSSNGWRRRETAVEKAQREIAKKKRL